MKQLLILIGVSAASVLVSCKQGRYYDLTAGEYIEIEKEENGRIVNAETHDPVYIYVDTKTHDTIYGASGKVINGYVVKTEDGKYKYEADDEYKVKYGDYKKKVDGDEVKIELSTPTKAGILKPTEQQEGEELLMLVMPLMLNQ